jgi:hypothetical protein
MRQAGISGLVITGATLDQNSSLTSRSAMGHTSFRIKLTHD